MSTARFHRCMIKQNYLTYIVLLTFWKNQNLPLKDTLDRRRNYCIWFNHFIIRAKITGNRSKLDYKGNKITPPPHSPHLNLPAAHDDRPPGRGARTFMAESASFPHGAWLPLPGVNWIHCVIRSAYCSHSEPGNQADHWSQYGQRNSSRRKRVKNRQYSLCEEMRAPERERVREWMGEEPNTITGKRVSEWEGEGGRRDSCGCWCWSN